MFEKFVQNTMQRVTEKLARNKYMKMYNTLSAINQKRLVNEVIPKGVTRQLYKTPTPKEIYGMGIGAARNRKILGAGAESVVLPSITGGVGNTATKVFYDKPATVRKPSITRGTGGVKKMLGGVTVQDKADFMKNFPNISPAVYNNSARHLTVEHLTPIYRPTVPKGFAQQLPKEVMQETHDLMDATIAASKGLRHSQSKAVKALQDWNTSITGKHTPISNIVDSYTAATSPKSGVRSNLRKNLSAYVEEERPSKVTLQLEALRRNIEGYIDRKSHTSRLNRALSYVNGSPIVLQDSIGGGTSSLTDIRGTSVLDEHAHRGVEAIHNIMQTADGRAVLSDPGIIHSKYAE